MLIIEYTVGDWGSSYRNSTFSVQFFLNTKVLFLIDLKLSNKKCGSGLAGWSSG